MSPCAGCGQPNICACPVIIMGHPAVDPPEFFRKHDAGKKKWWLLPFRALEPVVDVLMHGAAEYGEENWQKCEDIGRYKNALTRHFVAYQAGEWLDSKSGLPHLAHLGCNVVFLLWFHVVKGVR